MNDFNNDGICDENDVTGCQDVNACNYDASATLSGSCTFAEANYDCSGV